MAVINATAEEVRDPYDSKFVFVHNEDAADCYGEACGQYYEENGVRLKPRPHGH
jgi:hypothetical protein